jgi:G3E family GTPase
VWALLGGRGAADYRAASERGLDLLRELAPHAFVNAPGPVSALGSFDREGAAQRTAPGAARPAGGNGTPSAGAPFTTVVLRSDRPLHPGRIYHLLQELSRSALWTRGQLWLGGCPTLKIAVQGAGPRLRIDASGTWQDHGEAAETVLALTGEGLDTELLQSAFAACELEDGELAEGIANVELGPFRALAPR